MAGHLETAITVPITMVTPGAASIELDLQGNYKMFYSVYYC